MKEILLAAALFSTAALAQSNAPKYNFSLNAPPKQPAAKGINPVDEGAIVCSSLNEVNWLFREIGRARIARRYMPEETRQLAKLRDGYDPWAEPRPSDYRCQFVPTGTPMTVEWKGGIPVVFGKMSDGRPFAGVTSPMMVDH
ncbi:hypothetical protein FHX57_006736 [Paraburkholderia tropica]|uniref:hypothetical protein n=1 Tax=Paraburkholderia tropica TaxID=92647 RepID=UPI0016211F6F|nr:hypothetical protein [Paraburkholderia tropica]MBB3004354.1 hypothetical protein [Paraburkholderia tropica]